MQGALLPAVPKEDCGLEIATRYISAREVGGDLYDFLRYGPQQLGIALGDVSGKGTAAALYGAVGIGILRSLAPLKLPPAEMLRRLNQVICESKIEGRFMTLCFATWQRGRQKLRIANAGQSQPLLWKSGRCEKLRLVGFPLGIFDEVVYEEWSTTLDAGDIVVLYSDGLAESMNPEGDQFGVERLQSLVCSNAKLTAAQLAELIFTEVARFAQGVPAADDRTLVILKATAPSAPEEKKSGNRPQRTPGKAKLSYRENRELGELPARLEALEKEQGDIVARLADAALYRDQPDQVTPLRSRHAAIEEELTRLLARWEELEAKK